MEDESDFLDWARKQSEVDGEIGRTARLVLESRTRRTLRALKDLERYFESSGESDIAPLLLLRHKYQRQVKHLLTLSELMQKHPPETLRWTFEEQRKTFLQTEEPDIGDSGEWALTKEPTPSYLCYEVHPTAEGVLKLIEHLSEKQWVDTDQMLEALQPAIHTILHGNYV